MKDMITKKSTLAICIVGIAFLLCGSIWAVSHDESFGTDMTADNAEKLEAFAELEEEKAQLDRQVGSESNYAEFHGNVEEEKLLGLSESEAIDNVERETVEQEALYWYAINHGFKLTEEMMQERLDQAIAEAKTAENYEEVEAACKAAGTTFESTILENRGAYEKEYTVSDLYESQMQAFSGGKKVLSEDEAKKWEDHWNDFVEKTIAKYKKANDDAILSDQIDIDKKLIQDNVTNPSEIKEIIDKEIGHGNYIKENI